MYIHIFVYPKEEKRVKKPHAESIVCGEKEKYQNIKRDAVILSTIFNISVLYLGIEIPMGLWLFNELQFEYYNIYTLCKRAIIINYYRLLLYNT